MKRVYEFITKANQILLFLVLIAVALFVGKELSDSLFSSNGPQVAIVSPSAALTATEVRDVRYLGESSGYFIFGILRQAVSGNTPEPVMALAASKKKPRHDAGEVVNVIFSQGDKVTRMLLSRDGLVLRQRLSNAYDNEKFSAHVFTCISEDTNGDQLLDDNDRHDLVIADPMLKRPDLIIKNATEFEIISPTLMITKTRTGENLQFFQLDVITGTKSEIVWR